jgi:hypothetical protein
MAGPGKLSSEAINDTSGEVNVPPKFLDSNRDVSMKLDFFPHIATFRIAL